jgi:hypothetical protein
MRRNTLLHYLKVLGRRDCSFLISPVVLRSWFPSEVAARDEGFVGFAMKFRGLGVTPDHPGCDV